jgi:hypothetical protein
MVVSKSKKKDPCENYNSKDSKTETPMVFKEVTCKNIDENITEIS